MFGRLWTQLGVLLAAIVVFALVPAASAAPLHRIVAIGDLHGDYVAWRAIATNAQLIDAQGHWAGGQTVLVQVGDVVDRGPRSLDIVHDLMRLQREAPRAGGRVVALVGNHEAMNMIGDLRYVSAGDYAAFTNADSGRVRDEVYAANKTAIEAAYRKQDTSMSADAIRQAWFAAVPLGQIEHQRAWGPQGPIGRWVISNPAAIKLDDTLFVHGGVDAAYAKLPLPEINHRVAAALTATDTALDSIISDPMGPLWYRGYAAKIDMATAAPSSDDDDAAKAPSPYSEPTLPVEDELDQVLKIYGVRRMVIGHTPILSGIAMPFQGRLIRIDTGISAFYGGKLSYLEIIDGEPAPHEVARPSP